MTQSPTHPSEDARIAALHSYGILDTEIEAEYEEVTQLIARFCDAPISVINLIDRDRQWFKSEIGLGVRETPLDISICAHAILQPGLFIVPDTRDDPRFAQNPLVTGDPHLRFYAGALLETSDGHALGTLCVLDYKPRTLTADQLELLRVMAHQVMARLELRRTIAALTQGHTRERQLLESIGEAFFALDRDWRFTYVNAQAERVLLRERTELLGRILWDVFPESLGTAFDQEYRRAMQESTPVSFEEFYPSLSTWFQVRAYPSQDGLSVFFHDINARRLHEEELRASEVRFRQMADAIPHIAWTTAPDGNVDYYNQRWYDFSGLTFEETRDWGWAKLIHPDDLERAGGVWSAAIAAGKVSEVEYRLRRADGEYRQHLGRSEPVRNEEGQIIRWVGTATDIEERERLKREAQSAQDRVLQREHTIAEQLQQALQPPLPDEVAGLTLSMYYEATMEEAGVGGDFYDAFPLETGCTALVVGDLSGKGLAAATQVSTVRNMLRAFLYTQPNLADAVTDLNRTLAVNGLLTGFATLFVGCFDSATGVLRYVNCGQEPALVRRVQSGEVEELESSGPVMGAIESGVFQELSVSLNPGDALAIFTDGLTEVGPTRRTMLGVEGVIPLLRDCPDAADAERLAAHLINAVNAYAQSGVRDDVCLLIGVVQGGS